MRAAWILVVLSACVIGTDDDGAEDLGSLDAKADGFGQMTRNITLAQHRQSGDPSEKTYTITTAASFRVSVSYESAARTRLVVTDESQTRESPITWQPTLLVPASVAPRTVRIQIQNTADTEVPVRFHVATSAPRKLRVATFNIRWYGIGGDLDAPKAEYRNATLKAFIAANLATADLIVFEEIVDVAMLRTELAPAGWTCATYANTTPNHQFVVACHGPRFTLTHEADDDDFGYQPLAMNTLRPAVEGLLRDAASGAPIARIVGVHLKALPGSTDQRLQQAEILAQRLVATEQLGEQLPTIVLGDFNAHRKDVNGHAADDWTLIDGVFKKHPELGLSWLDSPFTNTFRDKTDHGYRLDHLWLGRATASDVTVAGPCNLDWTTGQAEIVRHFDEISDHCPVIATLTL